MTTSRRSTPLPRRPADRARRVRRAPWLRPARRPEPFEALAWAICEQLIEYARAAGIERRIVWRARARAPTGTTLRDLPSAAALAGTAPALLESFDLAGGRALALRRAAREVARGRVELRGADHERGWRRLRAMPGIGAWTVECLALHGQGRLRPAPRRRPRAAQAGRAPAPAATRGARARSRCARSSPRTAVGRPRRSAYARPRTMSAKPVKPAKPDPLDDPLLSIDPDLTTSAKLAVSCCATAWIRAPPSHSCWRSCAKDGWPPSRWSSRSAAAGATR